jgi:hypothetical protein
MEYIKYKAPILSLGMLADFQKNRPPNATKTLH